VDSSGNIYVTGLSTATWGSPQRAFGGGAEAFAAKLDSLGQLVWNTFLGGTGYDSGHGIAVDGNSNVYVAGSSFATWGSPQQAFGDCSVGVPLGGDSYGCDAFAAKLDNSGQLVWNTFLGGYGHDYGGAIAVDGSGNAYVAGGSEIPWGLPQRASGGGYDAFVAKLDHRINTATAVTSNANPATYGQSVSFTASVSPATATGTVTFKADGNAIAGCGTNGVVDLSNGSATCAASALTAASSPHAITAAYSGDATYVGRSGSLANGQTVKKANASVTTWPAASAITYGQTLASATLSGGAATPAGGFAFTSPVTKPSAGTAAQSVTYTPTETGNYYTAINTVSVTVGKADQTILPLACTPSSILVDGNCTLSATGGPSGNPVIFSSLTTGVCTVSGSTVVTGKAAGVCTIAADQAGNDNYNPAPQATQPFPVGKASQTILSLACTPSSILVDGNCTLSATGGASGNPVIFSSLTTGVCTVSGSTVVTGKAAGVCTIAADQAGNDNYNPAPQATLPIPVGKANQAITFGAVPTVIVGGTGTVTATGGASGNPVTFSSTTTALCTTGGINGSTVTGKAVGSCIIAANQTGNASYNAVPQAILSFTVSLTNNPQRDAAAECLFNWAEKNYSHLFGPSGIATQTFGVYNYRHYANTNGYLGVSSADEHVYYQGEDGILQDEGALSEWLPKAGCAATPPPALNASECLFNWAEKNYSNLFAPVDAITSTWETYNYRHYVTTNAYLGVSTSDNHVYYMGPDGEMADQGPTSKWLPMAGCQ